MKEHVSNGTGYGKGKGKEGMEPWLSVMKRHTQLSQMMVAFVLF